MSDLRAVVDRIEGEMAVLLLGRGSHRIVLPVKMLPEGVSEGVVIKISFELDRPATEEAKRRVQDLIDRLGGGKVE